MSALEVAIVLFIIILAVYFVMLLLGIPLYYVAGRRVYKKMGIAPWKIFIPYYVSYVLYQELWETKYFWITVPLGVCSCIAEAIARYCFEADKQPIQYMVFWGIGLAFWQAYLVIVFLLKRRLASAFHKGDGFAWGLTMLSGIFMAILGFGKASYIDAKKKKKQKL